jgi:hypothetical protein
MSLRKLLIGAALLVLTACYRGKPNVTVHLEEPDILVYQGSLSAEANTRLFELYRNATSKPRLLRVTSGGGDINLGMDLGEWVFRNGLDVEVVDHCMSSCANYVFTAARTKYLHPDSILMWHGGAHQADMETELAKYGEKGKAILASWRTREDAFFKTIGVVNTITTYGQTEPRPSGTKGPFDYSIDDMAKFGVTNVIEKDGTWRWRELRPEFASQIYRMPVITPP